jgi:hypothetical protein
MLLRDANTGGLEVNESPFGAKADIEDGDWDRPKQSSGPHNSALCFGDMPGEMRVKRRLLRA